MQTQTTRPTTNATGTLWQIDPTHTSVEYGIRHMFTTFRGVIAGAEGTLRWDPARPQDADIDVRVPLSGLDTRLAARDEHLRGPDFFDSKNHPDALLRAHGLEPLGAGEYRMRGTLTLRGISQPVDLHVRFEGEGADPWGAYRAGATATTEIDRKDFGMTWNAALDKGGIVLGERVQLVVHVEAVRVE